MQFKGLGAPQQAFCNANGVCIDRHIACRCRRCIYVCPACNNYEASQCASQIWKTFCDWDYPFLSSTWSGRLFFFLENFRVCIRSKQGKPVPTRNFWIRFYKSEFKNACWASPKPDIQHKIALTVYSRWCRMSKFSWRKICSMKIGVDSSNITSNRNYYFRFWR